jgi:CelD/BcsL family acetyltransferase involved in cellulose biosynthesis
VFLFYDGNDLVGAMPLTRSRLPWRTLRSMGAGVSDYLHPLVRPRYEAAFVAAFLEHLDGSPSGDLLDLHQIREGDPLLSAVPSSSLTAQATCPVLDLPGTYGAYLATLSKSLRYDAQGLQRERLRRLRARLRFAETVEEAEQFLECFFRLHARRWLRRGLPGAFLFRGTRAMHRWFVTQALRNDRLRLSVLEVEDQPIGALYCMREERTYFFYQSGFDPRFAGLSPGSVLVAETIRRAIAEGATTFDFLRGDEPYKRRWRPQRSLTNWRIIKRLSSVLGAAGEAWNRAGERVESNVRTRLEGRGLI